MLNNVLLMKKVMTRNLNHDDIVKQKFSIVHRAKSHIEWQESAKDNDFIQDSADDEEILQNSYWNIASFRFIFSHKILNETKLLHPVNLLNLLPKNTYYSANIIKNLN